MWDFSVIKDLLMNPVYTGAIASQKKDYRFKIGTIGEKKPEDWIVVEGQHEPLIDRMSFDIVQNKLKSRQRPGQTNEISLFGEKLYLSPILDLHSSDLVSYTISDRPVLSMVTTMLDEAFAKIPAGTNLILHSDQGWQYQHKQYQQMLREKGVRQSMSRKGNCLDNAVIENFFGLLKSELLYLQEFQSMEHFRQELVAYLDYYNNRRIKAKLKGLPPAIHRQQALSAA